jgi:hypothetical protein
MLHQDSKLAVSWTKYRKRSDPLSSSNRRTFEHCFCIAEKIGQPQPDSSRW